ncbi:MAG: ABC transporter ATP-binding protein [Fimbriimonadaceae bacterium]
MSTEVAAKTVVETRGLCKEYVMGTMVVRALRDVDLTFKEGEFISIMGPSGSGKSTFMNMIGCLDRPTRGQIFLEGNEVSRMGDNQLAEIRNHYIGFVFQSFNLLPRTSATKNVELPLMYAGKKNRTELAREALKKVGLGDRMDHKPNELSGGQQQRVAIARAIVNDPVLIFGDEPTGNLDTRTSLEIMALFQELNRQGKTIVVVTHEEEIARFGTRIVRFRDGRVEKDEIVSDHVDAREEIEKLPPPEDMNV